MLNLSLIKRRLISQTEKKYWIDKLIRAAAEECGAQATIVEND